MKVELYEIIDDFIQYYKYYHFSGTITEEDMKEFVYARKYPITSEEIKLIEDFLKADNFNETFKDYLKQEYAKQKPEDVTENVLEFIKRGIYDSRIIESIGDVNTLLDNIDRLNEYEKDQVISLVGMNDIANYINNDGKQKYVLLEFCAKITDEFDMLDILEKESDRAKFLIFSDGYKSPMLPTLKNGYYRNLLIKQLTEYEFTKKELIENINRYDELKKQLDGFENEEDKASFICSIEDYDIRLDFLSQVKSSDNRKMIVDSFNCEIDSSIKPQVELVQQMIREFFEDKLGEKFDDQKREKLDIVFNKSNVKLQILDGDVNGRANYLFDNIIIHTRHKNNTNKLIGFLAHEYSHLLARFDYKTTREKVSKNIDEGMADTFADLVINHYLEKHGKVEIDSKAIRIDNPYQSYSGYDFGNGWSRTMLYGLSKSGKDSEAVGEYFLGSKRNFCELIFGKDNTANRSKDEFGVPSLDTDKKELYDSPQLDFENIDFKSIYAKRNFILPLFELQNRLKNSEVDIVGIDREGKSYYARYIGDIYFNNRQLYDIRYDEMAEFADLLIAQKNPENPSSITNLAGYFNTKIDELIDNPKRTECSFEILHTSLAWITRFKNINDSIINVLGEACVNEIERINSGQTIEESLKKYQKIVPQYLGIIRPSKNDSENFLYDYFNDLKYAYINQLEQSILDGKINNVIDALTDSQTGEVYLDDDIKQVLVQNGIKIDYIIDGLGTSINLEKKSGLNDCMQDDKLTTDVQQTTAKTIMNFSNTDNKQFESR